MQKLKALLRSYLSFLRRWFIASPRFYIPYTKWKINQRKISVAVPQADTRIVIEAYPRSGNSFAYQAFKSAQDPSLLIGHHTHAPASILYAAERNIPTLVIIRQPRDAVLSNLIFHPSASVKTLLYDYCDFYKRIENVRGKIVLASFDSVVQDLGKVISTINSRFDTSFSLFEHSPENVKAIFEILDERNVATRGSMDHNRLARPSEIRAKIKQENAALYDAPSNAKYRENAEMIYNHLLQSVDV